MTLTPEQVDIVAARRMVATRTLIEGVARDAAALISNLRQGSNPTLGLQAVVAVTLRLVEMALLEIDAMERGCGQPDGECLDPCHAGVR